MQAKEDNNKIWGTIITGCNQDGRTMSPITAPSMKMQMELLKEVYTRNKIDPGTMQYIEAHGMYLQLKIEIFISYALQKVLISQDTNRRTRTIVYT